jgi:hypothetical protein
MPGQSKVLFLFLSMLSVTCGGCRNASPAAEPKMASSNIEINLPKGTIELGPGGDWRAVGGAFADVNKAFPASQVTGATAEAQLMESGGQALRDGILELSLIFETGSSLEGKRDAANGSDLVIRIPLSSSADAYGESRSCIVLDNGHVHFDYRAGLDEKNFVSYSKMESSREFHFLVNKYLCRALAAPFPCRGKRDGPKLLPANMGQWKIRGAHIDLHSNSSAAKVEVSKFTLTTTGKAFDYATCAKIAPSNGLCCVQHKTTEWHCGGKPEGDGWHQVSGDCYHRETGGSCSDNEPLESGLKR